MVNKRFFVLYLYCRKCTEKEQDFVAVVVVSVLFVFVVFFNGQELGESNIMH